MSPFNSTEIYNFEAYTDFDDYTLKINISSF